MRLLVLGGTRFIGHAIVTAAVGQGWEVTTFNRGLSGADVAGADTVRGDRTQAGDLASLTRAGRSWNAMVDTSGYVPRDVLAACQRLEPLARQYVFISTVAWTTSCPTRRVC
jgi:2'-hydroxyisoflavone reductase